MTWPIWSAGRCRSRSGLWRSSRRWWLASRCQRMRSDLNADEPHLLLPGDVEGQQRTALEACLAGRQAAVGINVPLAEAADSLQWARRALALSRSGAITAGKLIFCDDHLLTLWLSEDRLLKLLASQQFASLGGLSERQQERLTDTLDVWLETGGKAAEVAERLNVHPQTVRYRMRILERVLGGQLNDPESRFAMEVVLRARRLSEESSRQPSELGAEASLSLPPEPHARDGSGSPSGKSGVKSGIHRAG